MAPRRMGKDRPMLMAILSRSSMFCFFLLTPLFIGLAIQSGSGAYLSVQVGLCDARSMTMMMMYYVIDLRDFARSSDSCRLLNGGPLHLHPTHPHVGLELRETSIRQGEATCL